MREGLFVAWPYAALAVSACGVAFHGALEGRTSRAAGAQKRSGGVPPRSRALWRVGGALLAIGHLAGLAIPRRILAWNVSPGRLYALEGVAFAIGIVAFAGWIGQTRLHLRRGAGGGHPSWADVPEAAFLSALGVALASGLAMALVHRWASSWGAMILAPYAASLARGRPDPELARELPFLAQLHVTAAFAALALAGWTRPGALVALGLRRALGSVGRSVAGAAAVCEAWLRKRNPAAWLWPDED